MVCWPRRDGVGNSSARGVCSEEQLSQHLTWWTEALGGRAAGPTAGTPRAA